MRKLALHWRILLGILTGVVFGFIFSQFEWGKPFVVDWIKPFGTIFINLLKLIAIPLIVTSLVTGIAGLKDMSTLSKMGSKTFVIYFATTLIALFVGLLVVNVINPGSYISEDTRQEMISSFSGEAGKRVAQAEQIQNKGPLQPIVDMVPENIFAAATDNTKMLQIILFSILAALAMMMIAPDKSQPILTFLEGANAVVLKIVDMIMAIAPFGVFALIASLVAESPSTEIFIALGMYGLTVIAGLAILLYVIYASLVKIFGGISPIEFYKKIMPAKLLAFSTSSTAATLPVTVECVEERLGVNKEVSRFVIPIGTTLNMDGTCLYQAVAAVFIAQVMGYDLTVGQQMTVVLTATLASLGAAPVPGAGMLMLVIVLESIGVDPAGIALIFAIDRPLDMCRTVVNVTGDAMICAVVNKSCGYKLEPTIHE